MKELIKNKKGSALLLVLFSVAAASTVILMSMVDVIIQGVVSSVKEERLIEAQNIAADFQEISKYLILYEKVIFNDNLGPLNFLENRKNDTLSLWAQGMGVNNTSEPNLMKACGGFDGKGRSIGEFKVRKIPVFCPFYIRNSLLSGNMLEQMVFQPMKKKGIIKENKNKPGIFELEIVYFDKSKGIDSISAAVSNFIGYNIGQEILSDSNQRLKRISTKVRFLTNSSGFQTTSSERFIQIETTVELGGSFNSFPVVRSDSLLMYPSTPKDFAVFIMYPTKVDGKRTNKFSESFSIPKDSIISGRFFFNGNIDVNLSDLPTFEEMAVITGDFVPPLSKADAEIIKSKFRKGIITRYSFPHFLATGQCSDTDQLVTVVNSSGFRCKNDDGTNFSIGDYFNNMSSACINAPATANNGSMEFNCENQNADCTLNCRSSMIVKGPIAKVTMNGGFGLVSAPIEKLILNTENVYGTVFGGYVVANKPVHFKSFSSLKVGDPGVGSQDTLDSWTTIFQQAVEGVSSPLINLPIVFGNRSGL